VVTYSVQFRTYWRELCWYSKLDGLGTPIEISYYDTFASKMAFKYP
jgi:hypothetical protein